MLVKFKGLIDDLVVDEERMAANLESTNGLVFSQAALLALVESGLTRDEAYRIVQRNAMLAWDGKGHLRDLLRADSEFTLTEERLTECFSLVRLVETSAPVFERLAALG
jgi:adenylosuccinate lyase